MSRYEDTVENQFLDKLIEWCVDEEIECEQIKMNLQGRKGWPDRLVLWGGPNLVFIEFKRPGEEPRKLQVYIHNLLRRMGFTVLVHDNADEAFKDVQARIRAATTTTPSNGPWRDSGGLPPVSETGEGEDSSSFESVRHPLSGG